MTFKTGGRPQGSEIMLVPQKEKPLISVPGPVFTTSPMRTACDEEADSACERTESCDYEHYSDCTIMSPATALSTCPVLMIVLASIGSSRSSAICAQRLTLVVMAWMNRFSVLASFWPVVFLEQSLQHILHSFQSTFDVLGRIGEHHAQVAFSIAAESGTR